VEKNMTTEENQVVLKKAAEWFLDKIIKNHNSNTKKLESSGEFNLNPLLAPYLSAFLTGSVTAKGIAQTLIYARTLGSSITTSFGQNLQSFISDVLVDAYGSIVEGVDIKFVDRVDHLEKYAQLKLGPNTINKDDVVTIDGHFRSVKNLARTNRFTLTQESLIVGVLYGTDAELSSHYRKLRDHHHYPVIVGEDFWARLTGDKYFLQKLVQTIANTLSSVNSTELLEATINELAKDAQIIALAELGTVPTTGY
jgi:hypothetical protein